MPCRHGGKHGESHRSVGPSVSDRRVRGNRPSSRREAFKHCGSSGEALGWTERDTPGVSLPAARNRQNHYVFHTRRGRLTRSGLRESKVFGPPKVPSCQSGKACARARRHRHLAPNRPPGRWWPRWRDRFAPKVGARVVTSGADVGRQHRYAFLAQRKAWRPRRPVQGLWRPAPASCDSHIRRRAGRRRPSLRWQCRY